VVSNSGPKVKGFKTILSRKDVKAPRRSKPNIASYTEWTQSKTDSRASALKIGTWVSLRLCVLARDRILPLCFEIHPYSVTFPGFINKIFSSSQRQAHAF
jgi:hypothetical protein